MTASPSLPPFSLAGRVAVVTGSTTGLGKATALCLGRSGAKVAINYAHSKTRAEETLAELRAAGIEADVFQADATSEAGIGAMVTAVEQTLGPVDIVVVNATPPQPLKPIEDYGWDFYQQMLDFFVKSPYLLARRLLPGMKERRYGRMCHELAPHGITVNMIAPGWIPVERHEHDPQADKDAYFSTIPTGRWGNPEEVGWAAVYLASQEAGFVTGQTLAVNGGRTCW